MIVFSKIIFNALRDFLSIVQFKKREKKKNDGEVLLLSNIPLWEFFTLFKLYKWYQIPQSISYNQYLFLMTTTSIYPKYGMSFPFVIKLIGLFPQMGLIYVIF